MLDEFLVTMKNSHISATRQQHDEQFCILDDPESDGIASGEEQEANDEDMLSSQDCMPEYLLTGKQEALWDCESILSTYSNLDNHPAQVHERQDTCT